MRVKFQWLVSGVLALSVAFGAWEKLAAEESSGRSQSQLLRKGYDSEVTGKRREYFLYLPGRVPHRAGQEMAGHLVSARRRRAWQRRRRSRQRTGSRAARRSLDPGP